MKHAMALASLILLSPWLMALQEVQGNIPAPSQPLDERLEQNKLPVAQDPLWSSLVQCKVGYNEKAGLYTIDLTPNVKQLDGQAVSASGFVLPLDSSDKTKHFLLTKRTPVCLYCPPGEPNEAIEVYSSNAVSWSESMVKVSGKFSLINNGDQGIFFVIKDARTEQ